MEPSEKHLPQPIPGRATGTQSSGAEPFESGGDLLETLHVCPQCGSGLVYPQDWMPMDPVHWRVSLRCPECEWRSVGLYEQGVLDRFDQILDAGTDSLHADLRKLERSNMEAELRRFNEALDGDLILPEDF